MKMKSSKSFLRKTLERFAIKETLKKVFPKYGRCKHVDVAVGSHDGPEHANTQNYGRANDGCGAASANIVVSDKTSFPEFQTF